MKLNCIKLVVIGIAMLIVLLDHSCYSQSVGINNPAPAASSILDLTSTSKGFLVPRMTSAERISIASPAKGLLVFDNTLNLFYYHNGTAWTAIATPTSSWQITGNNGLNPSSNFIGMTDSVDLVFRTNNVEKLRMTAAGAFLALGNSVSGTTPAAGAGVRMMWIPAKGGFRAGKVTGTNWDDINIGKHSFAGGVETRASGYASTAFGDSTIASGFASFSAGDKNTASGDYSAAFGNQTTALGNYSLATGIGSWAQGESAVALGNSAYAGADFSISIGTSSCSGIASVALGNGNSTDLDYSVAIGNSNSALGIGAISLGTNNYSSVNYALTMGDSCSASLDNAMAIGKNAEANGYFSLSFGNNTRANSFSSVALGRFNSTFGSPLGWNAADELLVVGNGADDSNRSNAMVLLKNGKLGVGNIIPQTQLDVDGGLVLRDNATITANANPTNITLGNRTYLRLNSNNIPALRGITLSDGLQTGQIVIIECIATAPNGISMADSPLSNFNLSAARTLSEDDTITLIWNGTDWIELHFSDN